MEYIVPSDEAEVIRASHSYTSEEKEEEEEIIIIIIQSV